MWFDKEMVKEVFYSNKKKLLVKICVEKHTMFFVVFIQIPTFSRTYCDIFLQKEQKSHCSISCFKFPNFFLSSHSIL